jgi:hypothetical protein
MRYIHNGEMRDTTVSPPPVFVFSEPVTPATGRTGGETA